MKARILSLALALAFSLAASAADAIVSEKTAAAEIDAHLSRAREAIDSRHLSEAIRSYVAVLAICDSFPAFRAKAEEAQSALARIGTRLSLEPSSDWIDAQGTQRSVTSRDLAKGLALSPAVFLFESYGDVKSPVPDASITFKFVKNSGSLIPSATTDAYGKANSVVASLDAPGEDAVIRAYPEFSYRGRKYAFADIFRDFAYLPSVKAAKIAVLERSEFGPSDAPRSIAAIATALEPTGIQLSPYNGTLSESLFLKAFGGESSALLSFGLSDSLPYAAFALVDVAAARQMVYDGKSYDIYTAEATISFRIVRADGSVLFSLENASAKGQGGTRQAAVADAYGRSSAVIADALIKRRDKIKLLLASE